MNEDVPKEWSLPDYMEEFVEIDTCFGPRGPSLWINGKLVAGPDLRTGRLFQFSMMRKHLLAACGEKPE